MFKKFSFIIILAVLTLFIALSGYTKNLADELYDVGKSEFDKGNFKDASKILRKAFDEDPSNQKVLDLLVTSMMKEEKTPQGATIPQLKTDNSPSRFQDTLDDLKGEIKNQKKNDTSKQIASVKTDIQNKTDSTKSSPINTTAAGEPKIDTKQNANQPALKEQYLVFSNLKSLSAPQKGEKPVVNKIEVMIYKDITRIVIEPTKNANIVTEKLTTPPMLAIDILDSVNELPLGKKFSINAGIIKAIRHSQYTIDPIKATRVVVDLKNWNTQFKVNRQDNKIMIDIVNPVNLQLPKLEDVPATPVAIDPKTGQTVPLVYNYNFELLSYNKMQIRARKSEVPIMVKLLKNNEPASLEKILCTTITPTAGFKNGEMILNSQEVVTDNQGIVAIDNFFTSKEEGKNIIRLFAGKNQKDKFDIEIISIKPIPAKIIKITGDDQRINLNADNSETFVVEVQDEYGNKIGEGVPVIFSTPDNECMIDVNGSNSIDNEVVVLTDTNSQAVCEKFKVGFTTGFKSLKASILVEDTGGNPNRLLIATSADMSNAIETIIKEMNLNISGDLKIMVYETSDSINLKSMRDDLFADLKKNGKLQIMPQYNALYITDENIFVSNIPNKILNTANFDLKTTILRSVDFSINVTPRLVTVNFKGAELIDVVRTLAELGDWNIVYSEEELKEKQVNMHLIDVPAIVALDTILDMNDLTRVQDGNVMKIVPKAKAPFNALPIRSGYSEELSIGDNFITQIVPLTNADGLSLMETIRELKSENGKMSYERNTNSILITDSKSNVKKLIDIIKTFDITSKVSKEYLQIYKLNFELPSKVSDVIKAFIPSEKELEELKRADSKKRETTKKASDKNAKKDSKDNKDSKNTEIPDDNTSASDEDAMGPSGYKKNSELKLTGSASLYPYDDKMYLLIQTTENNHKVINSIIKEIDSNLSGGGKRIFKIIPLDRFNNEITPEEMKRYLINLKTLEANFQMVGAPGSKIKTFVPEEGISGDMTLSTSSSNSSTSTSKSKTVTEPKYKLICGRDNKILILGDKSSIDEIEQLFDFMTEVMKSGITLRDLIGTSSNSKLQMKFIDLSKNPDINIEDLKKFIVNLKTLDANYKLIDDKKVFIPESGYSNTTTSSSLDYWLVNKTNIIDPKYRLITTSKNKLLIIGDKESIDEVEYVISDLIFEIVKAGLNLNEIFQNNKPMKLVDLSKYPEISLEELKRFLINLKTLDANYQVVGGKRVFIPENGYLEKATKSIWFGTSNQENTIDPKYKLITTSKSKLLILGDKSSIDEIESVINNLIIELINAGVNLKDVFMNSKLIKIVDLSKHSDIDIEELRNFIVNLKTLDANYQEINSKRVFIPEEGYKETVTTSKSSWSWWMDDNSSSSSASDIIHEAKYKLITSKNNKLLIIGDKSAAEEIEMVINDLILEVIKSGFNLRDLFGKSAISKLQIHRFTLKYISVKQLEEYFTTNQWTLPFYISGLKSKTGREDIMMIGEKYLFYDFEKILALLDIPEIAKSKMDGIEIKVHKLRNITIEALDQEFKTLLGKRLSENGAIVYNNINQTIVIRDKAINVMNIIELFEAVDRERTDGNVMTTEIVSIKNMEVGSIKDPLGEFDNIKSKNGKVIYDRESNSVIIRDFPSNLKRIKEMIVKLDDNSKNSNWLVTKIFYLKYATVSTKLSKGNVSVTQINQIIDKIISSTVTAIDAKDGKLFGNVAYDERTNSVIVTTFRNLMPQVEKLIAQLDRREKQIMIEVMIVEREITNDEALGVNAMFKDGDRFSYYANAKLTDPDNPVAKASVGFGLTPGQVAGAPLWFTLNSKEFTTMLQALKNKSSAEVLSNPKILTLNNQPAKVELKDIIQTPKYEKDENGNYVAVEADKTDIPLSLSVIPQINNEREVLLNVDLEVMTLPADYDRSAGLPPSPTSRKINNMFYIADNQTIVIGGIIKKEMRSAETKLPFLEFLEKVPLLSMFGKKTSKSSSNKELLIFITPHIIDGTISAEQASKEVKDKYSHIIMNNFYLNTASRSEIIAMYLNNIYNNLVAQYFDKNRQLGIDDYNIKKNMPLWLSTDNASAFADKLAQAIVKYREQFGPFTSFEQLQFVSTQFMGKNVNISEDLYNEFSKNVLLNINVNLSTAEELARIKGFNYTIAQNIVNERKSLGYFKEKAQARYYFIKYGIPQIYYDNYLEKVIVVGDMKDKDSNQTDMDFKYKFDEAKPAETSGTGYPQMEAVPVLPAGNSSSEDLYNYQNNSRLPQPANVIEPEIPAPPLPENGLLPDNSAGISFDNSGKIDLNSVGAEELQNKLQLNKLDSMLIVKYRERNGDYRNVEELKNVYGLEKVYDSIKDKVYVR